MLLFCVCLPLVGVLLGCGRTGCLRCLVVVFDWLLWLFRCGLMVVVWVACRLDCLLVDVRLGFTAGGSGLTDLVGFCDFVLFGGVVPAIWVLLGCCLWCIVCW